MPTSPLHTILGSTGNIGTALAKDLLKNTDNIRLVSRNPSKINPKDQLMKAEFLNPAEVDAAVAGSDTVYLVAGITYKASIWQEQWPVIMKNVITSCKKHSAKLVFFDNMYCYDPGHVGHLTENSPVNPQSQKGKVRAEIAQMVLDEIKGGKLTAMIVKSADFYGPGAKLSFLNESVINRMKSGKNAQWLYAGDKKHSFTYISDAAYATAFLAHQENAWNQVWHLPTSKAYPTGQETVNILAKHLGIQPKLQILGPFMLNLVSLFIPVLKEVKELRYQLDQDYCFDSTKIEKAYGLKAISIEEGLKKCLE